MLAPSYLILFIPSKYLVIKFNPLFSYNNIIILILRIEFNYEI
ncbi:hypothetical protein VIBNISFn118_1260004 [Vibrio nigripulchritudo SFn118]|nr:hypothetical protein VIBNISFn118_1260004 [Vibrio nigripulchritudo SFn118]